MPRFMARRIQGIMNIAIAFQILLLFLSLEACVLFPQPTAKPPDFFSISRDLAEQLSSHRKGGETGHLILTTIVDLENLSMPTGFGRTLTETLSTVLFQHGYNIVEIRKAGELLIKKDGELVLTRDAELLAAKYHAAAILAGTYSVTPYTVIVNLRLLQLNSNNVLSVAGKELPRTEAVDHLLTMPGFFPEPVLSAYERQGG